MKVALLSSGSGSRGGGEIYLRFLAEGLGKIGHEVHALLPAAGRMDELAASLEPYAHIIRLDVTATYERRLRNVSAVIDRSQQTEIARQIVKLRPDIVHVNQQVAEDGLDFLLAAERSRVPWVSTIHIGRSAHSLGARLGGVRDAVTMATLRRPGGCFIAISQASKAQLNARFGEGWGRQRLHVVYNGVAVSDQAVLAAARHEARQDWGAGDADIVVGVVGRIEAQKNPRALIDYTAPLLDRGHRIRLVWIGDGTLRSDLEAYASSLAPNAHLRIDGWRDDASRRMAGFDLFALPSRYEGMPLALLEAMHAGLPVIASRTDGTPEAVRDGETGYLCDTAAEWTTALASLASDASLRARMSAASRADALRRFSLTEMARETAKIYAGRAEKKSPEAA